MSYLSTPVGVRVDLEEVYRRALEEVVEEFERALDRFERDDETDAEEIARKLAFDAAKTVLEEDVVRPYYGPPPGFVDFVDGLESAGLDVVRHRPGHSGKTRKPRFRKLRR